MFKLHWLDQYCFIGCYTSSCSEDTQVRFFTITFAPNPKIAKLWIIICTLHCTYNVENIFAHRYQQFGVFTIFSKVGAWGLKLKNSFIYILKTPVRNTLAVQLQANRNWVNGTESYASTCSYNHNNHINVQLAKDTARDACTFLNLP